MSQRELKHGVYTDEWAIGRTEAVLADFLASLASARPSRPQHIQEHVVITFPFSDGTVKAVRVFIGCIGTSSGAPPDGSNWTFEGTIHPEDCELDGHDPDINHVRTLSDIWDHEGRVTFLDGVPGAKLMVRVRRHAYL